MTFLLDVNVLIALIDPAHVHHGAVNRWFDDQGRQSWATCPITENGALRIVGHPRYGNSPGNPAAVADILMRLRALKGHEFWPDIVSLMASDLVDPARLLSSAHLTDIYLLTLAAAKGGRLATLDHHLMTTAVRNGRASLHLIPLQD